MAIGCHLELAHKQLSCSLLYDFLLLTCFSKNGASRLPPSSFPPTSLDEKRAPRFAAPNRSRRRDPGRDLLNTPNLEKRFLLLRCLHATTSHRADLYRKVEMINHRLRQVLAYGVHLAVHMQGARKQERIQRPHKAFFLFWRDGSHGRRAHGSFDICKQAVEQCLELVESRR